MLWFIHTQITFLFLLIDIKYTDSVFINGGPQLRVSSPIPAVEELNITNKITHVSKTKIAKL